MWPVLCLPRAFPPLAKPVQTLQTTNGTLGWLGKKRCIHSSGEFRERETNNDPAVYMIEQDAKVLLRFLSTSLSGLASQR